MFGSPSENWSEFLNWFTSLKLDGIVFDVDFPTDSLNIRNTNTNMVTRISRMVIESMEPSYRRQHIMSTIAQMASNKTGSVILGPTGPSTSLPYTINAVSTYNGPNGPVGAVGMPFEHQIDISNYDSNYNMKQKLFTTAEQIQIFEAKKYIRGHINQHINVSEFNMEKVVVAGGCFASLINHEVVKDFDVFMLDDPRNKLTVKALISFALDHPEKKATVGRLTYMQNDQIEHTLYTPDGGIQYITTKYKTREELINHFDFKHCCVSYDYLKDKLYMTREAFDLIKSKTLVPNIKGTPALWRYEKFQKRGWKSDEIAYL